MPGPEFNPADDFEITKEEYESWERSTAEAKESIRQADAAVERAGGVKSWDEMAADKDRLGQRNRELRAENERLRMRLLSAAGDDLCRLTQEEIKKYTSGEVQIP